jgi:hypothetical protein
MRMVSFEGFHFAPAYTIEVDPEFPGTGDWGLPVVAFDRDGQIVEAFESRWGTPLIVRVNPHGGRSWIAMFPGGGGAFVRGLFGCPNPVDLCVVVDGEALLVNVEGPTQGATIAQLDVTQVVPIVGAALLLLVGYTDVAAIGSAGVAWQSRRLAMDDLRVVEANSESVTLQGWMGGSDPERLVIHPATGEVIEGRRLKLKDV